MLGLATSWSERVGAILLILISALSADIFFAEMSCVDYYPDNATLEEGYWLDVKSFHGHKYSPKIPRQLPGVLDSWAGDGPKTVSIEIPWRRDHNITIYTLDSHESSPPILSVKAPSGFEKPMPIPAGNGVSPDLWKTMGGRSILNMVIPARHTPGRVNLVSNNGSWVTFEKITVSVKIWWVEYVCLLIFIVIYIYLIRGKAFSLATNIANTTKLGNTVNSRPLLLLLIFVLPILLAVETNLSNLFNRINSPIKKIEQSSGIIFSYFSKPVKGQFYATNANDNAESYYKTSFALLPNVLEQKSRNKEINLDKIDFSKSAIVLKGDKVVLNTDVSTVILSRGDE